MQIQTYLEKHGRRLTTSQKTAIQNLIVFVAVDPAECMEKMHNDLQKTGGVLWTDWRKVEKLLQERPPEYLPRLELVEDGNATVLKEKLATLRAENTDLREQLEAMEALRSVEIETTPAPEEEPAPPAKKKAAKKGAKKAGE